MHNVAYLLGLMKKARQAIVEDRYPQFLRQCYSGWYQGEKERYPKWAIDALAAVGVDLLADD